MNSRIAPFWRRSPNHIALTAENFGDALEDPSFLAMLAALSNGGYWFSKVKNIAMPGDRRAGINYHNDRRGFGEIVILRIARINRGGPFGGEMTVPGKRRADTLSPRPSAILASCCNRSYCIFAG